MRRLLELQQKIDQERLRRKEAEFVLENFVSLQTKKAPDEIINELRIILKKIIPFEESFIFRLTDHILQKEGESTQYPQGALVERLRSDKAVTIIYKIQKEHELPFLSLNGSAILFLLEPSYENRFLIVLSHHLPGKFSHHYSPLIKKISILLGEALVRLTHIKSLERLNQEIVEKQQMLVTATKFMTIGELSAGIAHEINNPLAIISGRAELLTKYVLRDAFDKKVFTENLDNIVETVLRIKDIVDALLRLSYGGSLTVMTRVLLKSILDDVVSLFREKMKNMNVDFILLNNTKADASIYCSRVLISQVFLNLLSNATYAASKQPRGLVRIQVDEDISNLFIRVSNSGLPIAEENVQKLFLPFFTTKPTGEGIGLGLSLARKYVEQHSGDLTYSYENGSVVFTVRLPKSS